MATSKATSPSRIKDFCKPYSTHLMLPASLFAIALSLFYIFLSSPGFLRHSRRGNGFCSGENCSVLSFAKNGEEMGNPFPWNAGSSPNHSSSSNVASAFREWNESMEAFKPRCNYFEGRWVKVPKPNLLYDGRKCSVIQSNWVCQKHRRPSFEYLKYEWRPNDCILSPFDPDDFLSRMQNKMIGFLGDSLARQQFQSLVCLLSANSFRSDPVNITDDFGFFQRPVFGTGWGPPKGLAYQFTRTNTSVIFIGNPFLCSMEDYRDEKTGTDRVAMHLDRPDSVLTRLFDWMEVVVVSNSHHFIPRRMREDLHDYFLNGKKLSVEESESMSVANASSIILHSLASFLHSKIVRANGKGRHPFVFFRTITPNHFFNGTWDNKGRCDHIQHVFGENDISHRMQRDLTVENATANTKILLMNITRMCQFRGDAHRGWFKGIQDCLHWCLPGVPDTWNQIMYSFIASKF